MKRRHCGSVNNNLLLLLLLLEEERKKWEDGRRKEAKMGLEDYMEPMRLGREEERRRADEEEAARLLRKYFEILRSLRSTKRTH